MSSYALQEYEEIVKWNKDPHNILRMPTIPLSKPEWDLAQLITEKLIQTREVLLRGGAGLAAPQIGINRSVFIFSPDRTKEKLKVATNPILEPIGTHLVDGEEACFSIPLKCTKIKRWRTVKARYQDIRGNIVEEILDDFAAKVFQHEMDHLKGRLTIDYETAYVLTFSDPEAFREYMQQVHLEDLRSYIKKDSEK